MPSQHRTLGILVVIALLVSTEPGAARPADAPTASGRSILFVENAGQWPDAARFQVWGSPAGVGTTWLARDAIWVVVAGGPEVRGSEISKSEDQRSVRRSDPTSDLRPLTSVKLTFPGSNPDVRIEPVNPLTTTVSYFIGNDPDQWRPAVPVYGGVRYVDLYPGVDLVLGQADSFWRFHAEPGAATRQVGVRIEDVATEALDDGRLRLAADRNPLYLAMPLATFVYQVSGISQQGDPFAMEALPSSHALPPTVEDDNPADLLYSTSLGSGGSGHAITVDETGSAYVTGFAFTDFPSTPGTVDPSFNGYLDAFVVKLNSTGSALDYATFLGGSDREEGSAIVVDEVGSAYVAGSTSSNDFPTTPGAFDPSYNGGYGGGYGDTFVAKLNPTGSELAFATFLGGSEADHGFGVDVDGTGSIYVTGATLSPNFPATPGVFQPSFSGPQDAFVVKLNPAGSALAYATFLGGSRGEGGSAIAVDTTGSAYVTGITLSSDFPTTPNAFDPSYNGGYGDAFAAMLDPEGSSLLYATVLGGSDEDGSRAIALDDTGSVYMAGWTFSRDFPTTPGAFDPIYSGGFGDAFVVKLDQAGSALVYATYVGDSAGDSADAVAVDGAGSAYVSGYTGSSGFPTTPGALDTSLGGFWDAFVTKLNPAGSGLVYSTFLGGGDLEASYAIALDSTGSAYLTGYAYTDFPTTPGAFDPSCGETCVFVAKMSPYIPDPIALIEEPSASTPVSGSITVSGFALDQGSVTGTGIDRVHLYLDGTFVAGLSLGEATYGLARPDVAALYGARFGQSGWELAWDTTDLAPGVHRLYLYAHRTTDHAWSTVPPHLVIVRGDHPLWLPIIMTHPR